MLHLLGILLLQYNKMAIKNTDKVRLHKQINKLVQYKTITEVTNLLRILVTQNNKMFTGMLKRFIHKFSPISEACLQHTATAQGSTTVITRER